ncbi:MAG: glucosaminidase domain-containing protein [Paludibacteraceae bacterium]|nr:glucosaminidase domain-containing protein [Paludibacteraceae bacterium]
MKKLLFIGLAIIGLAISVQAQTQNAAYRRYIEEWKDVAIQNQANYGIPASIIMAQALLESGAGQSELAVNANNHFGIKCAGAWMGGVYYYDDDSKGECFRQYADAAESFKDHSLFLQRPRYATCFEIAVEDYEGWAHRLRECGYATDKLYASKLIKLIEDYHLDTLVTGAPVGVYNPDEEQELRNREPGAYSRQTGGAASAEKGNSTNANQQPQRPLKATVVHQSDPIMVVKRDPEPPYVEPLTAKQERDSFYLSHPKKKYNGVAYVEAREGDTYANVAFRLYVRERDLREDNDALGRELKKGDRIYLGPKKNTGVPDKPFVWTFVGQSLWELSQEEGITIEAIQQLNELDPKIRIFSIRQKIYLRKVKE